MKPYLAMERVAAAAGDVWRLSMTGLSTRQQDGSEWLHLDRRGSGQARPIEGASRIARMFLVSASLSLVILAALIGHALGAETKIGTLSLAPIPEATTIEIRLPVEEGSDDLKLSVILADHFSDLLTEMGFTTVEAEGELILRFAVEEPTYAEWDSRFRHVGPAGEGSRIGGLGAGVLPAAFAGPAAVSQGDLDSYRLRVSVSRARRPPLWTGFIERKVSGLERQATYVQMAATLMLHWGRTYPASE